jgi:hypothetical protein
LIIVIELRIFDLQLQEFELKVWHFQRLKQKFELIDCHQIIVKLEGKGFLEHHNHLHFG